LPDYPSGEWYATANFPIPNVGELHQNTAFILWQPIFSPVEMAEFYRFSKLARLLQCIGHGRMGRLNIEEKG
jgi:hypothetical protein